MLSYDWLKMIGLIAALVFVWVMVFTTTATRIKPRQQFGICNYIGNVSISDNLARDLDTSFKNEIFSHETMETNSVDLTVAGTSAYELLQARTSVDEIDLVFVSTLPDADTAKEVEKTEENPDGVEYARTYLESFLSSYCYSLHDLNPAAENGYFKQMERYLNGYFTEGYAVKDSLDTAKVESDFRARIKKEKDKRYKKESQIKKGIEGEIERFYKYRQALVDFNDYYGKGYISLTTSKVTVFGEEKELTHSLNICPETMPEKAQTKLASYVAYYTKNAEGKTVTSAKDMNVCLFDSNGKEEAFRYEALTYLTHLIGVVTAE